MFRRILMVPLALAMLAFGSAAQAQIWNWSFQDMGVDYSLSFESLSGNVGNFTLLVDTRGYNHHADPAYLDSVDIKAWGGTDISFDMLSVPTGSGWSGTEGPISSGPASSTGCGGSGAGFACVEATTKGVFNVDDGPYTFRFAVTADSFNMAAAGSHVGAGYASALGAGSSYGITSVAAPIPEPETYAMILAGLAFLGFQARRMKKTRLAGANLAAA